jgi:hypothetical protein
VCSLVCGKKLFEKVRARRSRSVIGTKVTENRKGAGTGRPHEDISRNEWSDTPDEGNPDSLTHWFILVRG